MTQGSSSNDNSRVEPAGGSTHHPASSMHPVSTERVWEVVCRDSFAVISYVTPAGEPRSSGIVYAVSDHHLYFAVAPGSWKARHIVDGHEVAVTVPDRRGGVLSLLVPIPPATITFHARAIVHPPGALDLHALSGKLESLVPAERRAVATIIELVPEGTFLTYGIGVSLRAMTDPAKALAHVPVA
jgi:hypothetical protein